MLARHDAVPCAAQALAEAELRAGLLEAVARLGVQAQGLVEVTLEVICQEAARSLEPRERPGLALALGSLRECVEGVGHRAGRAASAASHAGFDQLGRRRQVRVRERVLSERPLLLLEP